MAKVGSGDRFGFRCRLHLGCCTAAAIRVSTATLLGAAHLAAIHIFVTFSKGKIRQVAVNFVNDTWLAMASRSNGLEHLDILHPPKPDGWVGHINGTWAWTKSWTESTAEFPSCEVPVGDVAACLEVAQKGDVWLALSDASKACFSKRKCIWGFEWATEPPSG